MANSSTAGRMQKSNGDIGETLNWNAGVYMCGLCKTYTRNPADFRVHLETHAFKHLYRCFYCSALSPNTSSMTSHVSKVHPGKEVYLGCTVRPTVNQIIHILSSRKEKTAGRDEPDSPPTVREVKKEQTSTQEKAPVTNVGSEQTIDLDESSDSDLEIIGESRIPVPKNNTNDQRTPEASNAFETKLQVEFSDGHYVCKSCNKTAVSPGRFAFHIHTHLHASTLKEHNCRYCRTDAVSISQKCKLVEQLMGILEKQKEAQSLAFPAQTKPQGVLMPNSPTVQGPQTILRSALMDTSGGPSNIATDPSITLQRLGVQQVTVVPAAAAMSSVLQPAVSLSDSGLNNTPIVPITAASVSPFNFNTPHQQTEKAASPKAEVGHGDPFGSPIIIEPRTEAELARNPIVIEPDDFHGAGNIPISDDQGNKTNGASVLTENHQENYSDVLGKEKEGQLRAWDQEKATSESPEKLPTEPHLSSNVQLGMGDAIQECPVVEQPVSTSTTQQNSASSSESASSIDKEPAKGKASQSDPTISTDVQSHKSAPLQTDPALNDTHGRTDISVQPVPPSTTPLDNQTNKTSELHPQQAQSSVLAGLVSSKTNAATSEIPPVPVDLQSNSAPASSSEPAPPTQHTEIQISTTSKSNSEPNPFSLNADIQTNNTAESQLESAPPLSTVSTSEVPLSSDSQSSATLGLLTADIQASSGIRSPPENNLSTDVQSSLRVPSPSDLVSSGTTQPDIGSALPTELTESSDNQSSVDGDVSSVLVPPKYSDSPNPEVQKSTSNDNSNKVEHPQNILSTKSVVKCNHVDGKFICDRCKFSVPDTKPRAFRKHLWSEVHPTMKCNHRPASVKDDLMPCPIIKQLMTYLLNAKAKNTESKPKDTDLEKPPNSSYTSISRDELPSKPSQELSGESNANPKSDKCTDSDQTSLQSSATVTEGGNHDQSVPENQSSSEVERIDTPPQAPSPSLSTAADNVLDTTVKDKDAAIPPTHSNTADTVSISDDLADSPQVVSHASSDGGEMEVQESDTNLEHSQTTEKENPCPGDQIADGETSSQSTGMFVISSVVSQAESSQDNKEKGISSGENKETHMETEDVDGPTLPEIEGPEQLQIENKTAEIDNSDINVDSVDSEVRKNEAEFRSNPELNTHWAKPGPKTFKDGKFVHDSEGASRAWGFSWSRTRPKQHVPPPLDQTPANKVYVCAYYRCSLYVALDTASFKIHNLLHHQEARNFSCAFCPRTFSTEDNLIIHMDTVHMDSRQVIHFKSYHCGFKNCWLACERDAEFLDHNTIFHANSESFPCCFCDQTFMTVPELIRHIDGSVSYSCTLCPEVTTCTYVDIQRHLCNSFHQEAVNMASSKDSLIQLSLKCVLSDVTGEPKPKNINRFVYLTQPAFAPVVQQEHFTCPNCSLVTNDKAYFESHVVQCITVNKSKPWLLSPAGISGVRQELERSPTSKTGDRRKTQHKERDWDGEDIEFLDSSKPDGDKSHDSNPDEDKSNKSKQDDDKLNESKPDDDKSIKSKEEGDKSNESKPDGDKSNQSKSDDCVEIIDDDDDDEDNDDMGFNDGDGGVTDSTINLPPGETSSKPPVTSPSMKDTDIAAKPLNKTVLHSLGEGLDVSCENCSFKTTFRVVHAIHERVHKHKQDTNKMLWCPHCPYSTDTVLYFKIHLQCHTEKTRIRLYHCTHCPFACSQLDVVDDHHEDVHNNLALKSEVTRLVLDELPCPDCPSIMKTEIEFLKHLEEAHPYSTIQKYLKEMYTIANLEVVEQKRSPQKGHTEPEIQISASPRVKQTDDRQEGSERFKCPFCSYSHKTCLRWLKHIKERHNSDNDVLALFGCKACSWKSTSKQKTTDHCEQKHGQSLVIFKVIQVDKLLEQEEAQGGTSDGDDVIELIDDKNDGDVNKDDKDKDSGRTSEHACHFCNYTTYDYSKMQEHWTTHEGQSALSALEDEQESADQSSPSKVDPKQLEYTEENLRCIADLLARLESDEMRSCTDMVDCPVCPYSTERMNNMRQHLRRHQKQVSIKNGYKCAYCAWTHGVEGVITAHMRKFHPDLPVIKIQIGNAQLKEEPSPTKARHACHLCPYTTVMKHNLLQHLDRHKKQNAITDGYKCGYCVFKSEFEGVVKKHISQYHPGEAHLVNVIGSPKTNSKPHTLTARQALSSSSQAFSPPSQALPSLPQALASPPQAYVGSASMDYVSPPEPVPHKTPLERLRDFSASFAQDDVYTNDIRHINQTRPEEAAEDGGMAGITIAAVVGSDGSRDVMGTQDAEHVFNAEECLRMERTAAPRQVEPMTSPEDSFDPEDEAWKFCMAQFCTRIDSHNLYRCNICTFMHRDSRKVHHHYSTRHRDRCPFQCGYCEFRSVAVVIIQKHCMANHSHLQVKVSPIIESLPAPGDIAKESPRPYVKRPKQSEFIENEGVHIETTLDEKYAEWMSHYYSRDRHKGYICNICQHGQKSTTLLMNHILGVHFKHYPYNCKYCSYRNIAPYKALNHTIEKHPECEAKLIKLDIPESAYVTIGRERERRAPVEIKPISNSQPSSDVLNQGTVKNEPTNLSGQTINYDNLYGYSHHSGSSYGGIQDGEDSNLSSMTIKTEPEEVKTDTEKKPTQEKTEVGVKSTQNSHRIQCAFCRYGTRFDRYNVRVHVLTCHLKLYPYSCRHCRWGSANRKAYVAHMAKDHPDLPDNPDVTRNEISSALSMVMDGDNCIIGLGDNASVIQQIYQRNVRGKALNENRYGLPPSIPSSTQGKPDPSLGTPAPLVIAPIEAHDGFQMRDPTAGTYDVQGNQGGLHFGMGSSMGRDQYPASSTTATPFNTTMQYQSDLGSQHVQMPSQARPAKPKGKKKKQKTYTLHKCKACGRGYIQKAKAQYHYVIKHLNLHPYMCNYCEYGANIRNKVFEHIRRDHPGREEVVFPAFREHALAQNKIVPVKADLSEYKGILKKAKFINDSGMLHAKDQREETTYHCPQCVDTFQDVDLLGEHVSTSHQDYVGFKCCHCKVYIKSKAKMKYHHDHRHTDLQPSYLMFKDGVTVGNPMNTFSERIRPQTQYLSGQMLGSSANQYADTGFAFNSRPHHDTSEPTGTSDFQRNISGEITGDFIEDATLEVDLPAGGFNAGGAVERSFGGSTASAPPKINKALAGTKWMACKHCSYTTWRTKMMRQHVMTHVNYRPFRCSHCSFVAITSFHVKRHMVTQHRDLPQNIKFIVDHVKAADLVNHYTSNQTHGAQGYVSSLKRERSKQIVRRAMDDGKKPLKKLKLQHQGSGEFDSVPRGAPMMEEGESRAYVCVLCGQPAANRSRLLQHIMLELNYCPWHCPHCAYKDVTLYAVKEHCFKMHPMKPFRTVLKQNPDRMLRIQSLVEQSKAGTSPEKPVVSSTKTREEFVNHKQENNGYSSSSYLPQNNLNNSTYKPQTSHEFVKMPKGPPYKCAKCTFQSPDKQCYRNHIKRHGPPIFKCIYCTRTGVMKGEMHRHVRNAHPDKPCELIDLRAQRDSTQQSSMTGDNTPDPGLAGQGAPETTPSSRGEIGVLAQLDAELRDMASEDVNVIDSENTSLSWNEESPGQGDTGDDLFSPDASGSKKKKNKRGALPEGAITVIDGIVLTNEDMRITADGMHHCQLCSFSCSVRIKCSTHVTKHFPPRWKCGYCKATHQLSYELRRHIRHVHKGNPMKMIRLESPENSVPTHSSVPLTKRPPAESHNQLHQSSTKPGPACSKKFKPNPSLTPRLFCCYHCNFKTSSTLELVQHQKMHAESEKTENVTEISSESSGGESDTGALREQEEEGTSHYKCEHCPYTTENKEAFKVHKEFAHTPARPFKCPYCSFTGFASAKVKSHCRRRHKDQPVSVIDQRTSLIRTGSMSDSGDPTDTSMLDDSFETEDVQHLPEQDA